MRRPLLLAVFLTTTAHAQQPPTVVTPPLPADATRPMIELIFRMPTVAEAITMIAQEKDLPIVVNTDPDPDIDRKIKSPKDLDFSHEKTGEAQLRKLARLYNLTITKAPDGTLIVSKGPNPEAQPPAAETPPQPTRALNPLEGLLLFRTMTIEEVINAIATQTDVQTVIVGDIVGNIEDWRDLDFSHEKSGEAKLRKLARTYNLTLTETKDGTFLVRQSPAQTPITPADTNPPAIPAPQAPALPAAAARPMIRLSFGQQVTVADLLNIIATQDDVQVVISGDIGNEEIDDIDLSNEKTPEARFQKVARLHNLTITKFEDGTFLFSKGPTRAAVTITALPGERQTFAGFGTSLGNWGRDYQKLTPAERDTLSGLLWRDLKMKSLRLWLNLNEYAPQRGDRLTADFRARYIDSGIIADARKNGVVDFVLAPDNCPDYLKVKREGGPQDFSIPNQNLTAYAELIAQFIAQIKAETGVLLNVTGLQNEPNDLDRFGPEQYAPLIKALRTALDKRGLRPVKIIATENANVDDSFYAQLDAIKADSTAWKALDGISSHSYNMAANDKAASTIEGSAKSYWMTESSANGPEEPGDALRAASLASRFLSDMNHRVTHWIHFLGFETPDPNDNATRIIAYTPGPLKTTVFAKHATYQELAQTFDVGARFRDSQSSLDGDMTWTYGPKPRLTAATAKNPDGSWAIALSNFTSPDFAEKPDNTGYDNGYRSHRFDVTVEIPELKAVPSLKFKVKRTSDDPNEKILEMKNGVVTIPGVEPLQLVTLRSQTN